MIRPIFSSKIFVLKCAGWITFCFPVSKYKVKIYYLNINGQDYPCYLEDRKGNESSIQPQMIEVTLKNETLQERRNLKLC